MKLLAALTKPKLMRNERIAARLAMWKSCSARGARVERSTPTTPPTKALTKTSSANCRQFARSPSRIRSAAVIQRPSSRDRAAVGSSLQLGGIVGELAALIELNHLGVIRRRRWDARKNRLDERLLVETREGYRVADCSDLRCQGPAVETDGIRDVAGQNQDTRW